MSRINRGVIYQGQATTLLDRVETAAGVLLTQADITSITAQVTCIDTASAGDLLMLDKTAVIHDTLQTGGGWTRDTIGWNSAVEIPGDNFASGGVTYQVVLLFTSTSGSVVEVVWHLDALKVY